MRTALFLIAVVVSNICLAQGDEPHPYDFSKVDTKNIDTDLLRRQYDSIYYVSGLDSINQLLMHVYDQDASPRYGSFNIGYQSDQAVLGDLTAELQSLGFSKLSNDFGSVPWGIDIRGKRTLLSYYIMPGIKNTAENDEYKVEVRGINMTVALGYDIINLKRLNFYPQAALIMQDFDIHLKRKNATRDIQTITGLVANPAGGRLENRALNASLGLELDYHLLYSPKGGGGVILALRYGRVLPLSKGKFKIDGRDSSYKSDDRISESFFAVVLKFYTG